MGATGYLYLYLFPFAILQFELQSSQSQSQPRTTTHFWFGSEEDRRPHSLSFSGCRALRIGGNVFVYAAVTRSYLWDFSGSGPLGARFLLGLVPWNKGCRRIAR